MKKPDSDEKSPNSGRDGKTVHDRRKQKENKPLAKASATASQSENGAVGDGLNSHGLGKNKRPRRGRRRRGRNLHVGEHRTSQNSAPQDSVPENSVPQGSASQQNVAQHGARKSNASQNNALSAGKENPQSASKSSFKRQNSRASHRSVAGVQDEDHGGGQSAAGTNRAGKSEPNSSADVKTRNKNKRRRKSNGSMRHVRAPVSPTPDVTFSGQRGNGEGDNRERVNDEEGESSTRKRARGRRQQNGKRYNGYRKNPAWQDKRADKPRLAENKPHRRGDLYAALDLGTNNCRLLVVAAMPGGRFKVVDGFSRIVRLGEGLGSTGMLSSDAMDRATEALLVCAKKLKNPNIKKARLIATEACRRAQNGEEFMRRVRDETGLDLEIVDRETEALLAAEGCGALIDKQAEGAVLFDIGGGSSELVLVDRGLHHNGVISKQIAAWTSLPLGVVTLAEHHGGQEVSRQTYENMIDEVHTHLERFEGRSALKEVWDTKNVHLLGTSGTVTTLAGLHLKLPSYDRRKVDGIWLADFQIDNVIDELLEMDFDARAQNPCIGNERADLVLAGCAILQAIRQTWPCKRLRVADRGLREGILTQLMRSDDAWSKIQNSGKGGWRRGRGKRQSVPSEGGNNQVKNSSRNNHTSNHGKELE